MVHHFLVTGEHHAVNIDSVAEKTLCLGKNQMLWRAELSITGKSLLPTSFHNDLFRTNRGYRILLAVIEDLLKERGMAEASDVILTGCSCEEK